MLRTSCCHVILTCMQILSQRLAARRTCPICRKSLTEPDPQAYPVNYALLSILMRNQQNESWEASSPSTACSPAFRKEVDSSTSPSPHNTASFLAFQAPSEDWRWQNVEHTNELVSCNPTSSEVILEFPEELWLQQRTRIQLALSNLILAMHGEGLPEVFRLVAGPFEVPQDVVTRLGVIPEEDAPFVCVDICHEGGLHSVAPGMHLGPIVKFCCNLADASLYIHSCRKFEITEWCHMCSRVDPLTLSFH